MSSRKKDPAFLMYSRDFLAGTMGMNTHEIGQYILLLCLQHQSGGSLSGKQLAAVAAYPTADATAYATADASSGISPDVLEKFDQDEAGKYFNERLQEEMQRRAEHSEKQREKAEKRWKKKKEEDASAYATAYAEKMPLSTATANGIKKEDKSVREGERFSLHDFSEFALRPTQWREGIWMQMQKKGRPMSSRIWGQLVDQFTSFQEVAGKLHWPDEQDAKKHFFSWLNKRRDQDVHLLESAEVGAGPSAQQEWKKEIEQQS